jgi:hypothetical protein
MQQTKRRKKPKSSVAAARASMIKEIAAPRMARSARIAEQRLNAGANKR